MGSPLVRPLNSNSTSLTRVQGQAARPTVAPRSDRVEAFEKLRQRAVVTQHEATIEERTSGEVQLAKIQSDMEAKWRAKGLLPSGEAYLLDGAAAPGKYIGKYVDLYA